MVVSSRSISLHPGQFFQIDVTTGDDHADPFAGIDVRALKDNRKRHGWGGFDDDTHSCAATTTW